MYERRTKPSHRRLATGHNAPVAGIRRGRLAATHRRTQIDEPSRDARVLRLSAHDAAIQDGDGEEGRSLLQRLRERRIVQWFIAYLAMAWLTLQLVQTLADIWELPIAVQRATSLALGLGCMPALVVAWYHGELGRQEVTACELAILTAIVAASVVVTCYVV